MKRLATTLLLLTALPAFAEGWVRYAQTDEALMYFDSLRTRKMGDTAFVWDLHDLKTEVTDAKGRSYRSVMYATEYQCRARKMRVLGITRHAQAMGKGEGVEEIMTGNWQEATPGSLPGELFNHICE